MRYYAGIDSGGSKTRGVLLDATGSVLALHNAQGASIVGMPSPAALQVLDATLDQLTRDAGIHRQDIRQCGIGLNGIDFADEFPHQLACIADYLGFPHDRVSLVNDGIGALWGASLAPTAAILQHGTGVTAAYRRSFGDERLFDHLNCGRQFDLRHELLRAVARMLDGRMTPTPLCERVLTRFGLTASAEYCEMVFRGRIPPDAWRALLPSLVTAWREGDPVATALVAQAIDDYALTANALIAHTGSADAEMAFGGGVITQLPEEMLACIAVAIHRQYPRVRVTRPAGSAEIGCAIMAAAHAGEPAPQFVAQCLARHASTC